MRRRTGSPITFETDGERLEIYDTVMDVTRTLAASGPLDPVRVSTDRFLFPVDAAVGFETETLTLPTAVGVYVRDEEGDVVATAPGDEEWLPASTYYLESTPGCKLYVKVFDAGLRFRDGPTEDGPAPATFELDGAARVAVGVRSLHERPAATITVPDEPEALREALPYLASSVKEWSCERSWPTLRGHPPRLERGAELDVPPHLSKPETGVTVAVPETYEALYTVAPLAYYLGADVVAAEKPEISLENGYTESLARRGTLAETARSHLRRFLFLDSLVRVGGYYSLDRREYADVAGELSFYPPELYGASLSEQLMEYLDVEERLLEPYLPEYRYDAVLCDDPADATLLPHLLDDFVPVSVRGAGAARVAGRDALFTGYSAGQIPESSMRLSVAGFEHAMDAPPREVSAERVALLGVGEAATDALAAVFVGATDSPSPEDARIDVVERPTVGDVREALETEYGLVHVGAPLADDGFVCADGVLDPVALDGVEARIVSVVGPLERAGDVLDDLVVRGATAGIASASVSERVVGRVVGRVLSGAPFAQAVAWADHDAAYRVAGDAIRCPIVSVGGVVINEPRLRSESLDTHRLFVRAWWGKDHDNGTASVVISDYVRHPQRLVGTTFEEPGALSTADVVDMADGHDGVYVLNGEVYQHESPITAADVRESARRALADATTADVGE